MSFTLDTDTLAGIQLAVTKTIIQDRGQSFTLRYDQSGFDQDFEDYGFSVELAPGELIAPDAQLVGASSVGTTYGSGSYSSLSYGLGSGTIGPFILDVSTLGTLVINLLDTILPIQERGRSMQISWSQAGFDQDLEIFGYGIRLFPTESEMAPDTQ